MRLKAMTSEEGAASNLHYDQSSRGPLTAHDGASEWARRAAQDELYFLLRTEEAAALRTAGRVEQPSVPPHACPAVTD